MYNVILCDDNTQFANLLSDVLIKECDKLQSREKIMHVGGIFNSGHALLEYIRKEKADVVFLDIDMPQMNGFDLAKILRYEFENIIIVFMSAYDNFVYNSFEFMPFAYVRKSHMSEELPKVLKRIINKFCEKQRKIIINTTDGDKPIDVRSIAFIESKRNYFICHMTSGRDYTCRGTLSRFENIVSEFDFFRIHSAYLVNLEHVERILAHGYILVKNESLPLAQRRAQEFKKRFMEYTRRDMML